MSFSFGSNNNTTNNGTASSFGGFGARRNSMNGPTSSTTSGLFGNSNTNSGGLFGNSQNTNTGGLFGKSNTNAGGLFGNTQNASSTTGNNTSSNLFGNSQSNTSGGLFGNSNTNTNSNTNSNTGGLFGNSNTNTTSNSGGLFGRANTNSGGLFSNSGTSSNTGGLFGSSNTNTNNTGGGLFGNTNTNPTSSNLFGNNNTGGLFGSANQPQTNTSTFGSNTGSNLFGNTTNTQPSFLNSQAPSTDLTVNNSNPYSYSQVLSNLQASTANMPESITTTIFSDNTKPTTNPQKPKSSSLLGKLGQTFKFLRNTATNPSLQSLKGLFTSSEILNSRDKQKLISSTSPSAKNILAIASSTVTPKAISRPSYKSIDARRIGSMKRLTIKSKLVKYHLIDVNKIFNAKRRKVVLNNTVTSDKILQENYISEDEEIDEEMISDKAFARFKKDGVQEDIETKTTIKVESNKETQPETTVNETDLHDGYWSSPSVPELLNMSNEQLSNLENFIVGRVGCGQIAYNYPVDLTKIVAESNGALEKELFGKIIQIGNKMVITYKDCPNKPPIGNDLNVPATITLENVKPKQNLSIDDHIKFLKKQVGMEFITYDPITHIWVFKVKHFSVWGLVDEDEDLLAMKRKQDDEEEEASMEYSKLYENEKFQQELKKQKLNEQTKIVPGGWEYSLPASENPMNIKRKLVSEEIINELTKYKNDQSTNVLSEQVSNITIDSERSTPEMELDEDEDVTGVVNYMKQLANYLPPGTNLDDIVDEKAYEPEISNDQVFDIIQSKPNLPTADDWLLQLELANQLNSALAPLDRPLDQRMTIEKVDDLLFSDFNKNSINMSTPTKSKSSKIEEDNIYTNNIPIVFHELLVKSQMISRENGFPKLQKNPSYEFSFKHIISEDLEENQIISLASSLFDEFESFGKWLKNYNSVSIQKLLDEFKDDPLEKTFIYLCAGDLIKAIETSMSANNNHLSVIVTLSDSNDEVVKSIAKNQLISWKDHDTLSLIPKSIVKIYQLLARELDDVIQNLPWNIAFAVKLFYGDNQDIKSLLNEFKCIIPKSAITDVLKVYTGELQIESTSLNDKLKWFACTILNRPNDSISKSFGDYLSYKNYWKEGIIVYSQIENADESKQLIIDLIRSKIQNIISKENHLVEVLKLPRTTIYEALAIHKRNNGDYWGEVEALLKVNLYEEAHTTIVSNLGPSVVISNSSQSEEKLNDIFDRFPQKGLIISDWNIGAGIYKTFLNLESNDVEGLQFLLNNIPLIKYDTTLEEKIALNIISKKVGNLIIENKSISTSDKQRVTNLKLNIDSIEFFDNRLSNL
ncbi:unnamed protein product [Candida verbasci]|uniref:Peptidase S59 domain-containing protein n=1 Tax=Candida verbasci TaxID=1227364 RepID=A0A9W4TXH8_9ASCO|nr:unnamed protein product [Candida verbasci]